MKEQIKTAWLAALRSGEFTQGFDQLADKDGNYCCLGVLCELAVRDGITTKGRAQAPPVDEDDWDYINADANPTDDDDDDEVVDESGFKCADIEVPIGGWYYLDAGKRPIGGELPKQVKEWAGLDDSTRIRFTDAFGGPFYASLAEANDSHRLTFTQISDGIEEMHEQHGQDPEDQDE